MAIVINKGAIEVDVQIVRGDDFQHVFRIGGKETPESDTVYWNLSSFNIEGQVRKKPSSDVLANMSVEPIGDQNDPDDRGMFRVMMQGDEGIDLGTKMFPTTCVGDIQFIDPSAHIQTFFRLNFTVELDYTR